VAFIIVAILGIIMILGFGLAQSRYMSRKLSEATAQLEDEVENRTRDIAMLQRLASALGASSSMAEAGEILRLIIGRVLPRTRGGIYIAKASRNLEELLVSWGKEWDGALQFESQHFSQSLCIPLVAQGESLGTFTILTDAPDWSEKDIKMARILAEQLSITLASLQFWENLHQQADRDPLTGLFNRRYLMESLRQAIGRAERHHAPLSALMFDIDNFKRFNDSYGHDRGDLVLQRIAGELQRSTRKEDTLSQYGGEEFYSVS
jgi:GGDEF domain-containing protein